LEVGAATDNPLQVAVSSNKIVGRGYELTREIFSNRRQLERGGLLFLKRWAKINHSSMLLQSNVIN
jgi:hypothetical protein